MARVGAGLTGNEDPDDDETPLESITGGFQKYTQPFLGDPKSRAALLQIGLNMMQPPGFGQSTGGHIARSVAGGGEAVDRINADEWAREKYTEDSARADRALDIKDKEADNKITIAELRGANSYNREELERLKADLRNSNKTRSELVATGTEMWKNFTSPAFSWKLPENAEYLKYKGKNPTQIADMLAEEYKGSRPGGGTAEKPPEKPATAPAGKPRFIRQGGYTYELQPDGTYK